jgi:hypothetical protein
LGAAFPTLNRVPIYPKKSGKGRDIASKMGVPEQLNISRKCAGFSGRQETAACSQEVADPGGDFLLNLMPWRRGTSVTV